MFLSGLLSFIAVLLGIGISPVFKSPDTAPGAPLTDPACANPPPNQCAFYPNCLESRYQCGPDGYPVGYGQYYCQKFSDNLDLFNARGQRWIADTMHCLQLALVEDAIDATPPATTCAALKEQALATHPGCYVSNGFCMLGTRNWEAVLTIVNATTLFGSWDAFKATVETAGGCGEFYAFMIVRGLF